MRAWIDWAVHQGDALVDLGALTRSCSDGLLEIGAYSIMEAPTFGAVQDRLAEHPHRQLGGGFEILELIVAPAV